MGKIENSWRLMKVSWSLLRQDRELLWLPVLGMLSSAVLFVAVYFGAGLLVWTQDGGGASSGFAVFLLLACSGIASTFGVVFFEGALVAGAHERMIGGDPTIRSAISYAAGRVPNLLGWAAVSGTVGLFMRTAEQRGRYRSVTGFIGGLAWSVASFLVIPAIIIDNHRVFGAIKTSVSLIKRTWGENLIAHTAFGLLAGVLSAPFLFGITAIGATADANTGTPASPAQTAGIIICLAGVLIATVAVHTLSLYFKTALYEYAHDRDHDGGYDPDSMTAAFRTT